MSWIDTRKTWPKSPPNPKHPWDYPGQKKTVEQLSIANMRKEIKYHARTKFQLQVEMGLLEIVNTVEAQYKAEARKQKAAEVRKQKQEAAAEVRKQKAAELRKQKQEAAEARKQKSEDRKTKAEDQKKKAADRKRKAEDGKQKAENQKKKAKMAEVRKQPARAAKTANVQKQ